jgi:TonB family protein
VPEFPQEAIKARVSGTIVVPVLIDEDGNVLVYMFAAFGPYPVCRLVTDPGILALRETATHAAKESKFSPVMVDGKPVRTRGKLIYTFPKPDDSPSKPSASDNKPAQTNESKATVTSGNAGPAIGDVRGIIRNGTAISLPKPAYPEEARPFRASGKVNVRVVIDEKGNVFSAEAISGHRSLRSAAEAAACEAKFTPTLLSGVGVRVTGNITYNFVP